MSLLIPFLLAAAIGPLAADPLPENPPGRERPVWGPSAIGPSGATARAALRATVFDRPNQTTSPSLILPQRGNWRFAQRPAVHGREPNGREPQPRRDTPPDAADGDYGGYYTWPEMKEQIARWQRDYPALVHVTSLGKTGEGRDIPLLRLSDDAEPNAKEPEVMLLSGIHPREQQPQIAVVRLLDELLAGYGKDERLTKILKERQVWVVPVFNVDGKVYDMSHGDGKARGADWRKNRRVNGDGTFGVDLNRNFGVRWGGSRALDPTWKDTTANPKADIFEGPGPMSEPETQALGRFLASRGGNLRAFLDLHSPLHEILFPAYSVAPEFERFTKMVEGMRAVQKSPYPGPKNAAPDREPPATARGGNSGLTYTWAYYTQGAYGFNLEFAAPNNGRGVTARYAPADAIEAEYRDNVRGPLLYFLEAGGDLPPATPGAAACDPEKATVDGRLRPGATLLWTPPAVAGACDWAVLVSEGREIVVPSEYRRYPLRGGFVLEVDKAAKPGTAVPMKLYLWDKDRRRSVVSFTLTVAGE